MMNPYAALALGAGFAGSLWLSYDHGLSVERSAWELKWEKEVGKLTSQNAELAVKLREADQLNQQKINKVAEDAEKQIARANSAANNADAVAVGLHEQAAKLAAKLRVCSSNSGSAIAGGSAPSPAMVLSDLFRRADKRAGELARAYDECRIAALTCNTSYAELQQSFRVDPKQGIK